MEHLSLIWAEQQSVTKIISKILVNLDTPKAVAKNEDFVQQTGVRACFIEHLSQT